MKIILDAGHGLNTPGKRNNTMREFEFNSAVAEYARDVLKNYQDVEVVFVHDPSGKLDFPLSKRTEYANRSGAEVYVSIHANAGPATAHGIETFTYTTKPKEAVALATITQNKLIEKTKRYDRGVKSADFHVLRETNITSILVECGFMTHSEEAALLKSADYRLKCAYAIAEALVEHYKLKEKPVVKPASNASASPFAKEAQTWVIEQGISDGSRPLDPVTRQEMWVMLKNLAEK